MASSILSLNKSDQSILSAFQPPSSRSIAQSDIHSKTNKLQPIAPKVLTKRQQESMERINRLAQPRGRPYQPIDHVRSHYIQPITVKDLFGEIDDVSNVNSQVSDRSRIAVNDQRFQQLIENCENVHIPERAAHLHTVQDIIESNPSLQDDEGRWKMTNKTPHRTVQFKKHIQKISKQFASPKHTHLIDLFTC